jgi:hypothetical protein
MDYTLEPPIPTFLYHQCINHRELAEIKGFSQHFKVAKKIRLLFTPVDKLNAEAIYNRELKRCQCQLTCMICGA